MTRDEIEHLIRAASAISEDDELIVVGSQSILGQYPNAPAPLLRSMEADIYPKNRPERWELIDGSLGEGSPFHQTFGYYAQGVGPETAILPPEWQKRLIAVQGPQTRHATGWCLEIHDLLASKTLAHRTKDLEFTRTALEHRLANPLTVIERIQNCTVAEERKQIAVVFIQKLQNG